MCKESLPEERICPVRAAAQEHPESAALVTSATVYSWRDYHAGIQAAQSFFQERGVQQGDRVALAAPASAPYCALLWALFRLGAVACPLNPSLPQARMDDCIALLKPRLVLGERDIGLEIFSKNGDVFSARQRRQKEASQDGKDDRLGDSPATVVMTSGSAGLPKAALHSFNNHAHAARAANRNMPLGPEDRWLLSLSLFHVAGLAILFRCAYAGASVVLPIPGASLEDRIIEGRPTYLSLAPIQLYRLLGSSRAVAALRAMKGVLLGGAPASPSLISSAFDAGIPLVCSYGMTETAAQICATRPGASLEELVSSGRPFVSETVRLGADGMVEVRGEQVFLGYLTADGDCRRPETADGWFRTGDLGRMDGMGRVHITGRADAMFVCGGENIQPEEIEEALCALPHVRRAVVVPVPHDEYGALPVAFVDLADAPLPDAAQFKAALAEQLPRFKIPRVYLHWPADAMDGTKADRQALARKAAQLVSGAWSNLIG